MSSDECNEPPGRSRSRSCSTATSMEMDELQSLPPPPEEREDTSREADDEEESKPVADGAGPSYLRPRSLSRLLENDEAGDRQATAGHSSKRSRTELATKRSRPRMMHTGRVAASRKEPVCEICRQKLQDKDLKMYAGHPNDAVDEYNAVIDEKLCLFNGEEEHVMQHDWRAINKITSFNVYCRNGHLCPFDSGLVEREAYIYLSGYVKPIYSDDSSIEGAIPSKDIGPIVEWFVTGFDGGQDAIIVLSTPLGEYYLMQPSDDYSPFMRCVKEKTFISKTVIECLLDEPNSEYEDLLNKFETIPMPSGLPRFTEELLIHHAQFICDQILSFDESALPDEPQLIHAPCVKSIIDLSGVTFKKRFRRGRRRQFRESDEDWQKGLRLSKQKAPSWSKATTTQQVHDLFESFFPDQLDNTADKLKLKRRRCGACEACLETDCGQCASCKNMIKFGGTGTSKQACVKRRCPNMQLVEGDDDDYDEDDDEANHKESSIEVHRKMIRTLKKKKSAVIEWMGEPIQSAKGDFYNAVIINHDVIKKNDYIFIEPINSSVPMQVIKVKYMWENKMGIKILHGTWLWRGSETILGETSLPRELFLVDECQDVPLIYVQAKANVVVREYSNDCTEKGNIIDALKENSMILFYQKRYDHVAARFEDLLPELNPPKGAEHCFCSTCARDILSKMNRTPQLLEILDDTDDKRIKYGIIRYLNEEFRVGSAVYLKPTTFTFEFPNMNQDTSRGQKREIVDEEKYPEAYRKFNDRVKGSNVDTPEPFDIGYITSIYSTSKSKLLAGVNAYVTVKKMYRPENTHRGESLKKKSDMNMLYWSDEECDVRLNCIVGKCYIAYSENLNQSIEEWSASGPHRFYFSEAYDLNNEEYTEPPAHACNVNKSFKKDVKAKSKSKKVETIIEDIPVSLPQISHKLRTLDVFAGCGGLSEGLKQAGVAESLWAIENDTAAAHAYRLNNLKASVFTTDCNSFLEKVINGETSLGGQSLPKKGEVDLLCGGPPCQGFSGMNRFNSRAYSSFKNSLIVSFISFCDYYKPRFFLMENVRNFVSFKKSAVLKLTLSCLSRMGYQCTFGILQAGSYGIPQTRRRMILIAAAPGEILPRFPNPLHVFSKSTCQLTVDVDNVKYFTFTDVHESAPYRAITVYDALSDLPKIKSGSNEVVMRYENDPLTHFQRKMRSGMDDELALYDHICKDLGPLVEARMGLIPTKTGSDWRDLPNIVVRLSDGTCTTKLEYKYNDKKAGVSSTGAPRGICSCSEGKSCSLRDKQVNTLIPWCLPHTANRHNHWAGLYGRIEWDGFFSTTITNPEPMGKQGRVLHPEQTRVVSVRECARSQGFPDSFRFYGSIQDKHRQIGNAVPPPLAKAIGLEIRKSVSLREANEVLDRVVVEEEI
ncbi:hypothetical protein TSAR_015341 [Trichomalopsis sarcophagae]|uniref:DNA (cytosine-5)-methyltransferase n=1 Tax=Trichomalopsis sarcophagae TaxID=543379 RepID=A0A232EKE4_9HYME|nr:hypothetical protein TSAR_015341 [Trichomalopsis sarcophagae]